MTEKLRPPFQIHSNESTFWLTDQSGTPFCYTYWRAENPVGTGVDKPSQKLARQITVQVQRLPETMSELTHPILSRMSPEERAALARFIAEEKPGMGEGDALRELAREQLITLGLLALGTANRGRGNLRK